MSAEESVETHDADLDPCGFAHAHGRFLRQSQVPLPTQKADVLIGNMVQNHGTGLNFDF